MSTLMGEGGAFGPCSSQRSPGATSIFVYPFVGGERGGEFGGGPETKGGDMLKMIKFNTLARFKYFLSLSISSNMNEVFGLAKVGETQLLWLTLA